MINRPQLAREEAASPTDTARELAARVPAPIGDGRRRIWSVGCPGLKW